MLRSQFQRSTLCQEIKKAIEEFAFNEELRSFARKCYAELAEEEEDKEGEEDPVKTQIGEEA